MQYLMSFASFFKFLSWPNPHPHQKGCKSRLLESIFVFTHHTLLFPRGAWERGKEQNVLYLFEICHFLQQP